MTFLFPILLLGISIYVFYNAFTGKGKLYSLENIKDDAKEKVHKLLRAIYFVLGALMLVMALFNFLQTALYSNAIIEYEATDAYRTEFADVITDGTVTYENQTYTLDGKHSVEEMDAILRAAMEKHPEPFQSTSASCLGGGSSDIQKYYEATPLTDSDGKQVYTSSIGNVRSDTDDGSFLSKLYHAFSSKLLSILSYVFMGLALVGVVSVFLIIRKFTDKEKEAKAKVQATRPSMPSSAFNFDEEEKQE